MGENNVEIYKIEKHKNHENNTKKRSEINIATLILATTTITTLNIATNTIITTTTTTTITQQGSKIR